MERAAIQEAVRAGIFGLCTADALGVPVEFKPREYLREHPVTEMLGNGTYHQPAGTWSDDSSMTLCLADSLGKRRGLDPEDIMKRFRRWQDKGQYSPWWSPAAGLWQITRPVSRACLKIEEIEEYGSILEILRRDVPCALERIGGAHGYLLKTLVSIKKYRRIIYEKRNEQYHRE